MKRMWSSRIWTICSQMLYCGLMLLWVHVHLSKKATASRRGHGAQLRHPRNKACTQLLSSSQCAQDMPPSVQMSACVFPLTFRAYDEFQRWSQRYDRMLAPHFYQNISAPSTLEAALHYELLNSYMQRRLLPWLLSGKLSGKNKLQSSIIICILSAKYKDNHSFRGHLSESEAGSCLCCKEIPCKEPAAKYPFCSTWFWVILTAHWKTLSVYNEQDMIKWTRFHLHWATCTV